MSFFAKFTTHKLTGEEETMLLTPEFCGPKAKGKAHQLYHFPESQTSINPLANSFGSIVPTSIQFKHNSRMHRSH